MTWAIRTEGLTRDFGELRALDGLSIEVPLGVVFGFLGPNGAGKTTTIRLLLGLLEPSAGRCEVLGYDAGNQADAIRERTGALLEHHGLYERLTVEENLELYGRIYGISENERAERRRELLSRFGLWDRRKAHASSLSTGMKQKLAIARAVFHRPALLFLDEPTSGLDPAASVALRKDLMSLASQEGVTIFLTGHNLTEVEKICGAVGLIREGKLEAFGTLNEVLERVARPRVHFLGCGFSEEICCQMGARAEVVTCALTDESEPEATLDVEIQRGASVAPLVRLLVDAGVQLEEVRRVRPSLESAYLSYMDEAE